MNKFVKKFRGDSTLKYSLSKKPIKINPNSGTVRGYGVIPSCMKYEGEDEINKEVKNPLIAKAIIKSEEYKNYRADYCEILLRSNKIKQISNFSLILSPALDQLGIFEIKNNGKCIYRPWSIDEKPKFLN